MRILMAEGDTALAGFIRKGLEAEHYAVDVSADGQQARALAEELDFDLVVLDLVLPGMDGVSVLRHVRARKPSLPILVLTGRQRVEDRVQCLDLGADDYLVKPFSFSELSARIRALLRRCHLPAESVLTVGDLKLDRVERRVERGGTRIELTSKEFALLEYLMRNAGRRVTRAMIIEHVWNLSFDTCTNIVDVYVAYSTPIPIYDSLGASHVLTFTFTKTASNTWDYSISIPAADVGGTGNPTVVASGSLAFDGSGNLMMPAADVTGINITGLADGANDLTFDWKLYDANAAVLTQVAAPNSTSSAQQDGSGSGALSKFAIGSDGVITGSFSNGKTAVLGQLALATFANDQGLLRTGSNDFTETLASGQAVVGAPGTGGRGTLSGGALELSNVDIAKEFSAMIVAQRGFQANARVVTTFDEITQDTINLKR